MLAGLLLICVKVTKFPDDANPRALTFLTLLSYSSIVFTISATVTSFILADRLGEIPIRASMQSDLATEGSVNATPTYLLKRYGAGSAWAWGVWHCELPDALSAFVANLLLPLRDLLPFGRRLVHTHPNTCLHLSSRNGGSENHYDLCYRIRNFAIPPFSTFACPDRRKGLSFGGGAMKVVG